MSEKKTFERGIADVRRTEDLHLANRIDRLERIISEIPFEEIEAEADSALSHGFEMWVIGLLTGFFLYAVLKKKGLIQ